MIDMKYFCSGLIFLIPVPIDKFIDKNLAASKPKGGLMQGLLKMWMGHSQ